MGKEFHIRPARPEDAEGIFKLLDYYAEKGALLPRSREEILESIRDFQVVHDDQAGLIGCVAVKLYSPNLAEIRSLAVVPDRGRKGLGRQLIAACEKDALYHGIKQVFALTYVPEFFLKLEFERVEKESLPQKIWRDCFRCPHFPNCNETAVIKEVNPAP